MTAITAQSAPTAEEQEQLELINRARMDPQGEYDRLIEDAQTQTGTSDDVTAALRYFGVDPASFEAQLQEQQAQAPVAWSGALSQSANAYSNLMIAEDAQSHGLTDPSQLPEHDNNNDGRISLSERVLAQGYSDNWTSVGENIFAYGQDNAYTHAAFYIDWGYDEEDITNGQLNPGWASTGDGIQDPAGHRDTIMSDDMTEIGIAIVAENDPSTAVGPNVVTQHFAGRSDYTAQLLGVVIADGDGDAFYDIGEGLGGVTVTATRSNGQSFSATTWDSGGYQIELLPGTYTVTFSGGALDDTITRTVQMGTDNLKLDALAGDAGDAGQGGTDPTPPSGATDGNDTLTGTDDNDTLIGQAGDDSLSGGLGDDSLSGGLGNDTLTGGPGTDTLDGGAGTDRLVRDLSTEYAAGSAVAVVDLNTGRFYMQPASGTVTGFDRLSSIEEVALTGAVAMALTGSADNNLLVSGSGDDTLSGGLGDDTLRGGTGNDLAFAAEGDDLLQGEAGNDTLYGAEGGDTLEGGDGDDLLGGSDGRDSMAGGAGDDELWGGADNDTLNGGDGQDSLGGFTGNDGLSGGGGDDELWGGTGNDTLAGGDDNDTLGGAEGHDSLSGGNGDDELWGAEGRDTLSGGTGNDQLGAGDADDLLSGGSGNDTLSGAAGNDTLTADDGNDMVFAGAGDDVIAGGTGNDTLYGGAGADTFDFNAGDGADAIYASTADDTLFLDAGLWTGTLTEAQVISQFGSVAGADYILSFGSDSVTLAGLGTATQTQLETLIEIG